MKLRCILAWIFSLAALSVGARNFETGLSLDAPLYAAIGRQIAHTGEWFLLYGKVPEFVPFAEHPHLGFWLLATVFKWLPAADWSARLVAQCFYIAFFFIYFLYVRRYSGERCAVWSIVLLWSFSRFSNFFSNVYLDPGTLFFGSAGVFSFDLALDKKSGKLAALAGISLGLAFLYKGVAACGFLPVLGVLAVASWANQKTFRPIVKPAAAAIAGLVLVLGLYVWLLQRSKVPNFLEIYWSRQITNRFAQTWHWSGLIGKNFWWELWHDTYFLLPLALLSVFAKKRAHLAPITLAVTYIILFAPADRIGDQYWLMLLPWIAWLICDASLARIPLPAPKLAMATAVFSWIAVFVIQYIPVTIHGCSPSTDELEVVSLAKNKRVDKLILDTTPNALDVTTTSRYAWYADVEVAYPKPGSPVPPAVAHSVYFQFFPEASRTSEIEKQGWCLHGTFSGRSIWLSCGQPKTS